MRLARSSIAALAALVLFVTGCSGGEEAGPPATRELQGATTGTASPDETTSLEGVRIRLQPVAEVDTPVAMAARPGSDDLYVAEQGGVVRHIRVTRRDDAVHHEVDHTPVLDLSEETRARGEQGLLGLAFSPDGSTLYVDYTDANDDSTHIVAYPMSGERADSSRARELLRIPQPNRNHNGGQLAFGPDGYLYIGVGDGGGAGDPQDNGQNLDTLLGKILRIDPTPDAAQPYRIPADNPFAAGGGRPEIWLYGVRNPWRFSFDRETGDLWVADVGQNEIEEIDWLPATGGAGRGANLGWAFKEGTHSFRGDPPEGLVDPIFEYDHSDGSCSITGGYVYRGTAIPGLAGAYVFGDYCRAVVRGLLASGGQLLDERGLGVSVAPRSLSSFGEDRDGELYVLSTAGTVYRIEPA
ncbi:PQQ-dependent sugar dehydrogenase [Rhabdothermincola sediminis]|uniref:PQQ-dependent sugar dehydrogenase n=1 Tax=Rhabdothermincola sediminis TaxID=2751370 RepID=UPI001AA02A94|nr:PQQ-dependent sugar dehydrogenase [Rhabdothermincola sediminis]